MKTCPACNKVLVNDDPECPHCGIIISKWLSRDVPKAEFNAASVYSNKNNWMIWVVACLVFLFLIYWLNKKVEKKTAGMEPRDTVKIANRFALKTVGMDNPYQFIDFIRDGDIKAVNQYLSAGYSPNILVAGSLPITESMYRNNMEMFNLLIKNGADVNMKDSRGRAPLSIALERPVGNTPYFIRELVKAGANVEDLAIKENPKFKKVIEGNNVTVDNPSNDGGSAAMVIPGRGDGSGEGKLSGLGNGNFDGQKTFYQITGHLASRQIISKVLPTYPEWAEKQAIAMVSLNFGVFSDGQVKDSITIQRSSGFPSLDKLAITALKQWKFSNLGEKRYGEDQWGVMTFKFKLR